MNSKNFSVDKEQLLQTLSRFDDNISEEDVTDSGATSKIHSRHYHTFFLHVLLESLCNDIEPNEQKREILFSEVCKRLSESKFLNESVVLDSLLPLRREIARNFFKYVKQIHCQVVPNPSESSVTADSFLDEEDFCTKLQLQYRYEQSFEELEVIAKGGFGVVCKAKHKVTDIIYAVKKVIFKYKSDSAYLKVIREAKNIAALNHPNIVSYNNAWIECLPLGEHESDESRSSSSEGSSNSDDSDTDRIEDQMSQYSEALHAIMEKENESPSFEIVFSNRFAETGTRQRSSSIAVFGENYAFSGNSFSSLSVDSKTSSLSNTTGTTSGGENDRSEEDGFESGAKKSNSWAPSCLNVRVMLCIQMEYCDCDLRLWLDKRAEGKELPFDIDVMKIFKDILKGVVYIHSKGIIHRDLKPQNIFFSKTSNVLKIGDFGLATLTSCTEQDTSGVVSNQHSANLGTLPYAAPEQIKHKSYDSKVDIYSLGIILIELLNVFSTKMEFSKAINKILGGHFPKELEKNWPNHIHLVKNLVKRNPEDRICAKEILNQLQVLENSEIHLVKNQAKKNPKDIISAKEILSQLPGLENSESNEITRLKIALLKKDEEINRLQAIVKEQESIINKQRVELGQ